MSVHHGEWKIGSITKCSPINFVECGNVVNVVKWWACLLVVASQKNVHKVGILKYFTMQLKMLYKASTSMESLFGFSQSTFKFQNVARWYKFAHWASILLLKSYGLNLDVEIMILWPLESPQWNQSILYTNLYVLVQLLSKPENSQKNRIANQPHTEQTNITIRHLKEPKSR